MEILQIVARPFPGSLFAQDFAGSSAFAATIDFGQILEEEPGAVEQRQQRSIMIGGKWVKAGFYVGEVLPEKRSHVCIETSANRYRRIGMRALASGSTVPSSCLLRKSAHKEAVPKIPGNAWQLACAIGHARGDSGNWIAHGLLSAD